MIEMTEPVVNLAQNVTQFIQIDETIAICSVVKSSKALCLAVQDE